MEFTQITQVMEGGRIECILPDLEAGQVVEVHVVPQQQRKAPVFGRFKGLIHIHDNFDDPIEGFEPYI